MLLNWKIVNFSDLAVAMADVEDVDGLLEETDFADIEGTLREANKISEPSVLSPNPETESGLLDESIDDPELEAIKRRVREMEEEQLKLKQMQEEVEKQLLTAPGGNAANQRNFPTQDEKMEADQRFHPFTRIFG